MKNTTKKITSILLVLTIVLLCFAFVSCISINDDLKMKEAYLRQFGIEGVDAEDVVIDYDGGRYGLGRVVMLDAQWHDREAWQDTVGETTIQYYDRNQLLVYTFNKFYTLAEAKEKNILSDKDIESIANDFESKVTHYRDTCDTFDFEKCIIEDIFEEKYGYMPRTDIIFVNIDRRICKDNEGSESFDVAGYLGTDIIKNQKAIYYRTSEYNTFSLYICNAGYENMSYIFERLSKIPGVLGVGYYYDYYDVTSQAANDTYYSHYGMWRFDDIYIERV